MTKELAGPIYLHTEHRCGQDDENERTVRISLTEDGDSPRYLPVLDGCNWCDSPRTERLDIIQKMVELYNDWWAKQCLGPKKGCVMQNSAIEHQIGDVCAACSLRWCSFTEKGWVEKR